jgi:hypothetical protein
MVQKGRVLENKRERERERGKDVTQSFKEK